MWPFRSSRDEPRKQTEELLAALLPDVRRWVARYVGPRADHEDLVQEAMIELVLALPRFRGDSSVRTYAHRITLRTAAREVSKRRGRERHLGLAEVEGTAVGDPERTLAGRRALTALYDALLQVTEKRRNAFVLCAIERLDHQEAAAIEAVSVETLRARLKHARADLTRLLAQHSELSSFFGGES